MAGMYFHPTMTFRELVHRVVYEAYHANNSPRRSPIEISWNLTKLSIEIESRIKMGTRKTPQSQVQKPAYDQVKWINRNLTDEEKAEHDAANVKPVEVFKDLLSLCNGGYNISVKWDGYSSCYQATLIPYNAASPNYGYGLSARSAEPFRAISLLLFKHFTVLGEDWASHYRPSGKGFEG